MCSSICCNACLDFPFLCFSTVEKFLAISMMTLTLKEESCDLHGKKLFAPFIFLMAWLLPPFLRKAHRAPSSWLFSLRALKFVINYLFRLYLYFLRTEVVFLVNLECYLWFLRPHNYWLEVGLVLSICPSALFSLQTSKSFQSATTYHNDYQSVEIPRLDRD